MQYSKQLSKNKYLELYIDKLISDDYFDCFTKWTTRESHAGFYFNIEILGLIFNFKIYDTRHWNYELNDWEKYD